MFAIYGRLQELVFSQLEDLLPGSDSPQKDFSRVHGLRRFAGPRMGLDFCNG